MRWLESPLAKKRSTDIAIGLPELLDLLDLLSLKQPQNGLVILTELP